MKQQTKSPQAKYTNGDLNLAKTFISHIIIFQLFPPKHQHILFQNNLTSLASNLKSNNMISSNFKINRPLHYYF